MRLLLFLLFLCFVLFLNLPRMPIYYGVSDLRATHVIFLIFSKRSTYLSLAAADRFHKFYTRRNRTSVSLTTCTMKHWMGCLQYRPHTPGTHKHKNWVLHSHTPRVHTSTQPCSEPQEGRAVFSGGWKSMVVKLWFDEVVNRTCSTLPQMFVNISRGGACRVTPASMWLDDGDQSVDWITGLARFLGSIHTYTLRHSHSVCTRRRRRWPNFSPRLF